MLTSSLWLIAYAALVLFLLWLCGVAPIIGYPLGFFSSSTVSFPGGREGVVVRRSTVSPLPTIFITTTSGPDFSRYRVGCRTAPKAGGMIVLGTSLLRGGSRHGGIRNNNSPAGAKGRRHGEVSAKHTGGFP